MENDDICRRREPWGSAFRGGGCFGVGTSFFRRCPNRAGSPGQGSAPALGGHANDAKRYRGTRRGNHPRSRRAFLVRCRFGRHRRIAGQRMLPAGPPARTKVLCWRGLCRIQPSAMPLRVAGTETARHRDRPGPRLERPGRRRPPHIRKISRFLRMNFDPKTLDATGNFVEYPLTHPDLARCPE